MALRELTEYDKGRLKAVGDALAAFKNNLLDVSLQIARLEQQRSQLLRGVEDHLEARRVMANGLAMSYGIPSGESGWFLDFDRGAFVNASGIAAEEG